MASTLKQEDSKMNPTITTAQLRTVADMVANGAAIYSMSTHIRTGVLTVKGPDDGTSFGIVGVRAMIERDGRQSYSASAR